MGLSNNIDAESFGSTPAQTIERRLRKRKVWGLESDECYMRYIISCYP